MIDVQWFTEDGQWVRPAWASPQDARVLLFARGGGGGSASNPDGSPGADGEPGWVLAVTMDDDRTTDGEVTVPGWAIVFLLERME